MFTTQKKVLILIVQNCWPVLCTLEIIDCKREQKQKRRWMRPFTELTKKTNSTYGQNKRIRNNDFSPKMTTSSSRTNVLFPLNENASVFAHCFVLWLLVVFSSCFFFIFFFITGRFQLLLFLLLLVSLFYLAIMCWWSWCYYCCCCCCCCYDSFLFVLCSALNSNGFLHLDKWNLSFPSMRHALTLIRSRIHV